MRVKIKFAPLLYKIVTNGLPIFYIVSSVFIYFLRHYMLSIIKELFFFGWVFTLVILGLYMDMWISIPKEAFKEVFLGNFPWNLLIFAGIIYIVISILQLLYQKLSK